MKRPDGKNRIMMFIAKRLGRRVTEANSHCFIEAYIWRGKAYYTQFVEVEPPVGQGCRVLCGSSGRISIANDVWQGK